MRPLALAALLLSAACVRRVPLRAADLPRVAEAAGTVDEVHAHDADGGPLQLVAGDQLSIALEGAAPVEVRVGDLRRTGDDYFAPGAQFPAKAVRSVDVERADTRLTLVLIAGTAAVIASTGVVVAVAMRR